MNARATGARERIVEATAELLARGGREAVSTRAVSAAAGVQAPTLYRQFGDLQGLLEVTARETLAAYVREKATHEPTDDPLEDLRRGWDLHVAFGLANPAVYTLIYGDPVAGAHTLAARDGLAVLHRLVTRVAQAGRLRVGVPLAVGLISAAGEGVTLSLIGTPPEARDPHLPAALREAVLAAITIAHLQGSASQERPGADRVAARATALQAVLSEAPDVLSPAERHLLGEWLDRLTTPGVPASS
ncbi:TetR/AcrR family transcriptional regulator [Deinococcus aestuarii]|uniref:TetR/AcrR family transcriptional regulator n=1 Tax=Deinococcus aestuarii TaxID=2774531 RepID=UPI0031B84F64